MATKRSAGPSAGATATTGQLVKRTRLDDDVDDADESDPSRSLVAISSNSQGKDKGLVRTVKRTSGLSEPILSLSGGHAGEILDVRFSPSGEYIAAAGSDRTISIWRTYAPNDHVTSLTSHSKAVTCLAFLPPSSSSSSKPQLLSGSADSTIILWSPLSAPPHNKERRFRHHTAVVNTVAPSPTDPSLFASGSDDGNICIWNVDERKPWETLGVGYPVTAIEWAKDGSGIFVGGIDNQIHLYDLHRRKITYTLSAHSDTITSLRLSPLGSYLLSLSLDSSLKIWDVRPFAVASTASADGSGDDPTAQRLSQTLSGALASNESLLIRASWSRDGKRITSGSGDRTCVVWDVESSRILYKLPGHRGTCTAAALHPTEPIVVSSSTDGQLFLGEIEM